MSPAFRNVLIVSGLLKVLLAFVFADLPARYDETEYLDFGRAIAEEGAAPELWRAPGYQWLVALGLKAAGGRTVGVRLLQVALSIGLSLVTYRIGRRWRGETVGLAAGAFVALHPSLVAFSHLLWSETLYGFLVLAALDRVLAAEGRRCPRTAALAGLLFGAAALTRSLGLVLLGATVIGWALARRPRLAGAVLLGAALVVGPWAMHASSRAGRLVLVDTNSGFNVWSGNNRYVPGDLQGVWSLGLPPENGIDERFREFRPGDFWRREVPVRMQRAGVVEPEGPDGDLWYRAEAIATIRGDLPGALGRVPRKLAALWAPDFFLARHLMRDWYGPTPPALAVALTLLAWVAAAVPLLLGPVALATLPAGFFRRTTVLWLAAAAAAHALAYGHSRMHQPLVPLLALAAAALLFDRPSRPDRHRLLGGGLPAAAFVLALWVAGTAVVGGLYLAPGPRHVGFARGLAAPRALLLPGAVRLTWMLAEAEASSGNDAAAERVLTTGRHAAHPWSIYLSALVTTDREEALGRLEAALAAEPSHGPARVVLDRMLAGGPAPATRRDAPPGLTERPPEVAP